MWATRQPSPLITLGTGCSTLCVHTACKKQLPVTMQMPVTYYPGVYTAVPYTAYPGTDQRIALYASQYSSAAQGDTESMNSQRSRALAPRCTESGPGRRPMVWKEPRHGAGLLDNPAQPWVQKNPGFKRGPLALMIEAMKPNEEAK